MNEYVWYYILIIYDLSFYNDALGKYSRLKFDY